MCQDKLKCCFCKNMKEREMFYVRNDVKRGRSSYCKECKSLRYTGKKYMGKKGKFLKKSFEFEDGTKLCTKCNNKKDISEFEITSLSKLGLKRSWCNRCDSLHTRSRKFKLSIAELELKISNQDNKCKICGKHESELSKKLAIDHCHKTGKIRDLLCGKCNTGLGLFNDNVELLQKAINYINYHKE